MGKREQSQIIENLKKEGIRPYSISRLNAIDGCLLEAFYTYRQEDRGKDNVYGIMGSVIHDSLEQIYNGEADKGCLLPALKRGLSEAEFVGAKFPKDRKGTDSIRDGWVADMTDFCESFEKMDGNFKTEELIVLKVSDNRYLIGYVDLEKIIDAEKKEIEVYDFKTSSAFKKEDKLHHGRQLIVYGMALEAQGWNVKKLAWIMLKYIKVTYQGYARSNSKRKTEIVKIVQRHKLAKDLKNPVENMLYEAGYSEIDVEIMMERFAEENSLDVLPNEIKSQFTIEQHIDEWPFTDDLKQEALDYINSRADRFEELWDKPESHWTPVEINDKQTFYCTSLCSHREKCPELRKYQLMQSLSQVEDEDLF